MAYSELTYIDEINVKKILNLTLYLNFNCAILFAALLFMINLSQVLSTA